MVFQNFQSLDFGMLPKSLMIIIKKQQQTLTIIQLVFNDDDFLKKNKNPISIYNHCSQKNKNKIEIQIKFC